MQRSRNIFLRTAIEPFEKCFLLRRDLSSRKVRQKLAIRKIFQLGNPKLYEISEPIEKPEVPELENVIQDLHDTLVDFRARYGAGRAIASSQIGIMKRMIYMYIDKPTVFINPSLHHKSS